MSGTYSTVTSPGSIIESIQRGAIDRYLFGQFIATVDTEQFSILPVDMSKAVLNLLTDFTSSNSRGLAAVRLPAISD